MTTADVSQASDALCRGFPQQSYRRWRQGRFDLINVTEELLYCTYERPSSQNNYQQVDQDSMVEQEAFDIGESETRKSSFAARSETQNLPGDWSQSELSVRRTRHQGPFGRLGLGLDYDRIDTQWKGIDVASVGVRYGLGGHLGGMDSDVIRARTVRPSRQASNGTGRFASNDFWVIEGSYTRLQNIEDDMDIMLRVQGQWSNSLLTSTNQFKLGGPDSVRAYPTSEFLRDTGVFASLEWFWKAPGFADQDAFSNYKWGDLLKVSFFADYGAGTLNQTRTNPAQDVFQNIDIAGTAQPYVKSPTTPRAPAGCAPTQWKRRRGRTAKPGGLTSVNFGATRELTGTPSSPSNSSRARLPEPTSPVF